MEITVTQADQRAPDQLQPSFCDLFSSRIGADRFNLWFAGETVLILQADRVVVETFSSFAQDALRRMFFRELEETVRQVLGSSATVVFQVASDPATAGVSNLQQMSKVGASPSGVASAARAAVVRRVTLSQGGNTSCEISQPDLKSRLPSGRTAQENEDSLSHVSELMSTELCKPLGKKSIGRSLSVAEQTHRRESSTRENGAARSTRRSFSLNDFVSGLSNRLAIAAVEQGARKPGDVSPLVIHGPTGVGKTHLLEGFCSRARELNPRINAQFFSAEQFTTNFLSALHGSGLPAFRRTCRNADILVIDDLQFFGGSRKQATVMELQHTVDALLRQGRQVVCSCDRDPDSIEGIGSELLARLHGGMHVRLSPPDFEVRCGIVRGLAERRGLSVSDDVVQFVATHMTRHARELSGAINRLEAASLMLGVSITLSLAEESLADLMRSSGRSVRLTDIEKAVCSAFGLESGCLQSSKRGRTVNQPRMLAMFLARKHTPAALVEIGSYFGRRSHSTVISAHKSVAQWVSKRVPVQLAGTLWDAEEAIRRVEDLLRSRAG